jgi:hypothetical protein
MIGFNYRFTPAVLLATADDEGRLGHLSFPRLVLTGLDCRSTFPLVWRLDKEIAGLAHMVI